MLTLLARSKNAWLATLVLFAGLSSGCSNECQTTLTGKSWTPNVSGSGAANRDSSVSILSQTITPTPGDANNGACSSFGLTRAGDGYSGCQVVTASITMDQDLGSYGSLTLQAEATGVENVLGGAYPVLISLNDGTNELIGLSGSCAASGIYAWNSGSTVYDDNASCAPGGTSAYQNRRDWIEHQISYFGYSSVNAMPTCNWATGTPSCDFNSTFFSSGKLRYGANYTAKFILMRSPFFIGGQPSAGGSGGLKITALRKKGDEVAGGAVDVNVVLVGTTNIQASRTSAGKSNLDALLTNVQTTLIANNAGTTATNLKLGEIKAYEWTCEQGGDAYANVDINDLGSMFLDGTSNLVTSGDQKALNVFIVSNILNGSDNLTILGVAGGISGPVSRGLASSGLVFSSFDELETFSKTQYEFVDMGLTMAHEMGHYLGLFHPAEGERVGGVLDSDPIPDTPVCTYLSASGYRTISKCKNDTNLYNGGATTCLSVCGGYDGVTTFCPDKDECEFNHLMWWTSKNYSESTGTKDGNRISPHSRAILNYSAYVQ